MGNKCSREELDKIEKNREKLGEILEVTKYEKIPKLEKLDWLYNNIEYGQTIEQYIKSKYNKPTEEKKNIYIVPILERKSVVEVDFKIITEYVAKYFQMDTVLMETIDINIFDKCKSYWRMDRKIGYKQYNTRIIMKYLKKIIPKDAFCLLGICNIDLYVGRCNFVYGEAYYNERVGISSVLRFDKSFYEAIDQKQFDEIYNEFCLEYRSLIDKKSLMDRALKIVTHEIGHMFSLDHCIWYNCNMCGIGSLHELDRWSHNLCPICIQKIYLATDFNIKKRAEDLENFSKKYLN